MTALATCSTIGVTTSSPSLLALALSVEPRIDLGSPGVDNLWSKLTSLLAFTSPETAAACLRSDCGLRSRGRVWLCPVGITSRSTTLLLSHLAISNQQRTVLCSSGRERL